MSGSPIGWKRLKKLDRERGETFVHAWTYVHDSWHCIRHDGSSVWLNVCTGEAEEASENTYTTRLLRERTPRDAHEAEYLASLDTRFAELAGHQGK